MHSKLRYAGVVLPGLPATVGASGAENVETVLHRRRLGIDRVTRPSPLMSASKRLQFGYGAM